MKVQLQMVLASAMSAVVGGLLGLAAVPLAAQAGGAGTAPSTAFTDSLTELPVSLLPGERYIRLSDGCGLMVRPGDYNYTLDGRKYRWIGACRFGLIHGGGLLDYIPDPGAKVYPKAATIMEGPGRGRYYYGRMVAHYTAGYAHLPPSPEQPQLRYVSVNEVKPLDAERRAWYRRYDLDERFSVFSQWGLNTYEVFGHDVQNAAVGSTQRRLELARTPCKVDLRDRRYRLADDVLGHLSGDAAARAKFLRSDLSRLRSFCQAALARRVAELGGATPSAHALFDEVNYGYVFAVQEVRYVTDAANNITVYTDSLELCPQMTDITSCEPLWRAAQARYQAEVDALRPQVIAQRAATIAALDQMFAPHEAAMKRRLEEVARR